MASRQAQSLRRDSRSEEPAREESDAQSARQRGLPDSRRTSRGHFGAEAGPCPAVGEADPACPVAHSRRGRCHRPEHRADGVAHHTWSSAASYSLRSAAGRCGRRSMPRSPRSPRVRACCTTCSARCKYAELSPGGRPSAAEQQIDIARGGLAVVRQIPALARAKWHGQAALIEIARRGRSAQAPHRARRAVQDLGLASEGPLVS